MLSLLFSSSQKPPPPKKSFSAPKSPVPGLKRSNYQYQEKEPQPSVKRPRQQPLPTQDDHDDEIQEVVPVKTEPKEPAPMMPQVHQQPAASVYSAPVEVAAPVAVADNSHALATAEQHHDEQAVESYHEEMYEDYEQYGEADQSYDTTMDQSVKGKILKCLKSIMYSI